MTIYVRHRLERLSKRLDQRCRYCNGLHVDEQEMLCLRIPRRRMNEFAICTQANRFVLGEEWIDWVRRFLFAFHIPKKKGGAQCN